MNLNFSNFPSKHFSIQWCVTQRWWGKFNFRNCSFQRCTTQHENYTKVEFVWLDFIEKISLYTRDSRCDDVFEWCTSKSCHLPSNRNDFLFSVSFFHAFRTNKSFGISNSLSSLPSRWLIEFPMWSLCLEDCNRQKLIVFHIFNDLRSHNGKSNIYSSSSSVDIISPRWEIDMSLSTLTEQHHRVSEWSPVSITLLCAKFNYFCFHHVKSGAHINIQ